VSPNVAWNGSLKSYHPYLPPRKVSKIPKIECIYSRLPKNANSHFGRLGPLGVKLSFSKYSQFKKNILHDHLFLWQKLFLLKEGTSQGDFLIGCGAQLAFQAAPKILDGELSPSVVCRPDLYIVVVILILFQKSY
jgi:hypothetical protein